MFSDWTDWLSVCAGLTKEPDLNVRFSPPTHFHFSPPFTDKAIISAAQAGATRQRRRLLLGCLTDSVFSVLIFFLIFYFCRTLCVCVCVCVCACARARAHARACACVGVWVYVKELDLHARVSKPGWMWGAGRG